MASCNDCIHNEICQKFGGPFSISDADTSCTNFKSRSRFVELPCKVGDKVYELCRVNQFGDYKIDESEIKGFIVDTDGTAFDYELLGKRFFLTREEAEQALKERENDGK